MYSAIAANKRKSFLIMALFIGFASGIAYLAGLYLGGRSVAPFAIGGALLYTIISYFSASRLAVAMNGAKQVTKREEPRLYRIVENLSITEGIPTPKIYVIEDPAPNAFATGRNPSKAIVGVTRGLLDMMTDSELEGVMAHELGHIKNYDIRVSMVAFALASVIGIISDIFLHALFFGGGDDEDAPSNPIFLVLSILAIILAPLMAAMIQMAISRKREYLADASGALTTRYPEGLASALEKIGKYGAPMKKQNASTAHLFFANPLKKKSLSALFSTHPPVEDRIARLRAMDKG